MPEPIVLSTIPYPICSLDPRARSFRYSDVAKIKDIKSEGIESPNCIWSAVHAWLTIEIETRVQNYRNSGLVFEGFNQSVKERRRNRIDCLQPTRSVCMHNGGHLALSENAERAKARSGRVV